VAAGPGWHVASLVTDDLPAQHGCPTAPCAPSDASSDTADAAPNQALERPGRIRFRFITNWLIDGLWIPSQTGVDSIGLIGAHLTVAEIGRVHIWGPPGVLLVRADGEHGKMFRPAYTLGLSVYLAEFTFPGTERRGRLFVNLARCWTHGDPNSGIGMAGLSVTWKKGR
jgi:hypothetical protein